MPKVASLEPQKGAEELLSLPLDVRILLWRFVFRPFPLLITPVEVSTLRGGRSSHRPGSTRVELLFTIDECSLRAPLAPLLTCKQIYKEAEAIAYRSLQVCIKEPAQYHGHGDYLSMLSRPLLTHIQCLQIHLLEEHERSVPSVQHGILPDLCAFMNLKRVIITHASDAEFRFDMSEANVVARLSPLARLEHECIDLLSPYAQDVCTQAALGDCQLFGIRSAETRDHGVDYGNASALGITCCVDLKTREVVSSLKWSHDAKLSERYGGPLETDLDIKAAALEAYNKKYGLWRERHPDELSAEDHKAINLRAAVNASSTPAEELRSALQCVSRYVSFEDLQAKGIEPSVWYFRIVAGYEFRRERQEAEWQHSCSTPAKRSTARTRAGQQIYPLVLQLVQQRAFRAAMRNSQT